jgi:retron-type reverse transcriptase
MYETLMEAAVADENCQQALKAVKRNQGAAGIDRMTTEELEPHLQANWWILKDKLLKGTYIATPVRRVEIPKPSGGTRMLGIPTVSANCTRAQFAFGMGGDPPSVPSASRPALPGFESPPNRRY